MPKRSRKAPTKKPDRDENESAFDVLQAVIARTEATDGKDPLAVLLGRRGGLKGGPARAAAMTKKERVVSAASAAQARWKRYRAEKKARNEK